MQSETSTNYYRSHDEKETKGRHGGWWVPSLLLMIVTCIHVGVFVAVTVYTQRRLDDLDLKTASIHAESSSMTSHDVTRTLDIATSGQGEQGINKSSNRKKRNVPGLQNIREIREQFSHVCREQIVDILKQLADVSFRYESEADRVTMRTLIDSWISNSADDRQTRQTAGNELGGIFDQIANAELQIFEKYCGNASKICLPGEKGAEGQKGATGTQGVKGDTGAQGVKGATGAQGVKGDTGAQGVKGDTGIAGPKGEKGNVGIAGPRGGSGPKGEKGERGGSGALGAKGDTGSAGSPGPQGAKGSKGEEGEPGVKGDPGTAGAQGSAGEKGSAGDTGKQGPRGEKGEKGSKGHYGDSGPPGPRGKAGINGIPGYPGPKGDNGEVGETGAPGQRGADGAKGDVGLPGPPGQDGQKGEKGAMGLSGPPGPKGDKGYPGVPGGRGQKGEPGVWRPGMDSCCLTLSRPQFNRTEQKVTVKEDQSLTLHCGTQMGFPPPHVTWEPQGLIQSNPYRYKVTGAGDLVILNTTALDSRTFTCTATNALGTSQKTFDIRVLQHLVFDPHPSKVTVKEGDELRLECRVRFDPTTSPSPSLTWYHQTAGTQLQEVTSGVTEMIGGSILSIRNTHMSDRGTYVCEVKDRLETITMTENVVVLSKPYITNSSGPVVTAREGEDLLLHCVSDAVPTPVIHWNHDRNDSHVYEDSKSRLHIVDARKVDAGGYTCTATNSLGTDNRTIQVEVQVPPQVTLKPDFTPVKPSLLFDCIVSGDEPLQVQWLKGGAPLDKSDPGKFIQLPEAHTAAVGTRSDRLLVPHVTEDDVGVYQCEASNAFGVIRDTVYVYEDIHEVSCSDTFSVCNKTVCGARCPDNCQFAAELVVSSGTYSTDSSICKSAVHSGTLDEGVGGTVVWTNTANTAPFTALTVHGIQSAGSLGGVIDSIAATPVGVDP